MLTASNYQRVAVAVDELLQAIDLHQTAVDALVHAEEELRWAIEYAGELDRADRIADFHRLLKRLGEARRAHRSLHNDYRSTLAFVFT